MRNNPVGGKEKALEQAAGAGNEMLPSTASDKGKDE